MISNAVKYSAPKKDVIIRSVREGSNIKITVADTGIGMNAETQEKIFQRFFRVRTADAPATPGLGLGLYISSEIIRKHGGAISVASTPGKGSEFTFTLPIA